MPLSPKPYSTLPGPWGWGHSTLRQEGTRRTCSLLARALRLGPAVSAGHVELWTSAWPPGSRPLWCPSRVSGQRRVCNLLSSSQTQAWSSREGSLRDDQTDTRP